MMQISSSTTTYLPELGIMEDPTLLFEQYSMDYDFQSLVSECESVAPPPPPPLPPTPTKPSNSNYSSTSFQLISFDSNTNSSSLATSSNLKLEKHNHNLLDFGSAYYDHHTKHTNNNYNAATITRNAVQAQDHVMAERKRREKLNHRFITLSSIIPGLKKLDKASVLEDAIKYVKQLQEREKLLEEEVAMKTAESAVLLRRSNIVLDDDDENCDGRLLPEIEARVMGKEVLIRIHCHKHIGCEATILKQLQKLHLTIHSTSILPFGKTTLSITIVAQMDKQHCMTAKDFVKSLRNTLGQLVR